MQGAGNNVYGTCEDDEKQSEEVLGEVGESEGCGEKGKETVVVCVSVWNRLTK